jgi:transcriptional regulator with XRE-family HTH domain
MTQVEFRQRERERRAAAQRTLRILYGKYTDGQIAQHVGMKPNTIGRWRSGKSIPTSAHLELLQGLADET